MEVRSKKCARFTEGVAEIRQPSKYRIILYLCAEWEAEKGGRMGCLMKEKIQGLSFFYFLLCGNCVPHLETLHVPPAPLFPHLPRIFAPTDCGSTPSPIGWEKIRFHEFQHLSSRIRYFCAPKVTSALPGISYEYV